MPLSSLISSPKRLLHHSHVPISTSHRTKPKISTNLSSISFPILHTQRAHYTSDRPPDFPSTPSEERSPTPKEVPEPYVETDLDPPPEFQDLPPIPETPESVPGPKYPDIPIPTPQDPRLPVSPRPDLLPPAPPDIYPPKPPNLVPSPSEPPNVPPVEPDIRPPKGPVWW